MDFKKLVFSVIIIFFTANSCFVIQSFVVPKSIKRNFTLCYDSTATDVARGKILTKGFYRMESEKSSIVVNLLLYNDGIIWFYASLPDDIEDAKNYLRNLTKGCGSCRFGSIEKGLYTLKGNDTIVVEVMNDVRWAMPTWYARRYELIVINEAQLKLLRVRDFSVKKRDWTVYEDWNDFYFHPVDTMPTLDTWLTDKKWFHCDMKNAH